MSLKEIINNRGQAGELTKCEKVLGDLSRVYRIADFWDINSDIVELIAANELLDYATERDFDSKEFAAFKLGLNKMGQFMSACAMERKVIEQSKVVESDGGSQ